MMPERLGNVLYLWPQWLAALAVAILATSIGLVAGWTSPYLAKYTSMELNFHLTDAEASWVASLLPLGRLVGAVAGAVTVEYFGSKVTLVITGVPVTIGWICEICANSATWLYVYRLLAGITMGMFFCSFPLFLGEISSANIRGALVGLVINGMPFGTLLGNIMGSDMSRELFGIISIVLTLIYFILFPWVPKSPYFLVHNDKMDKAAKSLQFYNRKADVTAELAIIEAFVKEQDDAGSLRRKLHLVKEPKNRRAFKIVITLFIFMQLSGLNSVIFYMEIIVRSAKVTCIDPADVVIIVGVIGIIFGLIGMYLIDRMGRRLLLIISSACVCLSMIILGLHFYLLEKGCNPAPLQALPIISLILFMSLCIGLIPVPSTLLSELFPVSLKSIAGFVGSITSAVFAFISSKTYQPLVHLMTEKYVFWLSATIMALSIAYSTFFVPETKGKTLAEIQELLGQESPPVEQTQQQEGKPNISR